MDLTTVINAVLALASALITAFLIPWLKTKITEAQAKRLSEVISTCVAAAEQLYGPGTGEDKLAYVYDCLEERGYKVDRESVRSEVRAAIEAAVYELQK
jgi:hypothetical protein